MGSLIKFEFRKIYKKRMNIVVCCITIFLIVLFGIANIVQTYIYNEKGDKISGRAYVKYEKQIAEKSGGELTNEKAQDILAEYQNMVATPGYYEGEGEDGHFTDEVFYSYFIPHRQILLDIAHVYDDPGMQTWGSNLNKLSLNDIKPLYEAKKNRFQMILEAGSGEKWSMVKMWQANTTAQISTRISRNCNEKPPSSIQRRYNPATASTTPIQILSPQRLWKNRPRIGTISM